MDDVGKGVWPSSSPMPLLKQDHLLNTNKNFSGNLVPVFSQHHRKNKCLPMFRGNLPCLHWCLLPLVLSLSTEKSLSLSSIQSPISQLYTLIRSPLSLLQANQSQLSRSFFQFFHHLSRPLLNNLQYVHVSPALRSPELDTVLWV